MSEVLFHLLEYMEIHHCR